MADDVSTMELTIDALGAEGDGIATLADGGKIFVPLALPGERVRVHMPVGGGKAVLDEILTPSPDRVAPVSPHFGACGGCSMQHLGLEPYRDWKRGLLVGALAHAGLAADVVGPLVTVPPASRRRAAWFARRGADG
jgi:23S rRNA (uracil1939-C5)-methyltransferase